MKSQSPAFTLRPATKADADAIAAVFSPSLRLLSFMPQLYTYEDERWFIENTILEECGVMVAEQDHTIVAFLARDDDEIRLLHAHPDHVGKGAGTLLLNDAKAGDGTALELWCFQENTLARQFYERHGFHTTRFTDGDRNEQKIPDVLYRWER
jgi:putative acetyltransferase